MKKYLLLLLIVASFVLKAQQNFDTVKIQPQRVTDQIYMLKGSGGNIGLFIGQEGLLMIDDQYAPLSSKINSAVKSISTDPLKFLVNTHIHGDHTGGNDYFKKNNGVTIIAHDNVHDRMTKEQVNKRMNRTTPPREKDALPVITFADRMNFHLNDEDIEVIHIDRGHTDGDVIIHFKKANVFHTGDAFVRYGYPFIDDSSGGSINGFIATLEKLLLMMDDQTKIIPGHGEMATKADVQLLYNQVKDIRDQVAVALRRGKKIEDIPALGITDKYDEKLGKGFLKGKDFVALVAESLSVSK